MATATPLNNLPEEIQAMIAACADPRDILAFRATCKSLARSSHDAFVKGFFATRTHVYTAYGMKALIAIVENPIFHKHLKEIVLVAVSPPPSVDFHKSNIIDREVLDEGSDIRTVYLTQVFQICVSVGLAPVWRLSTDATDFQQCFGFRQITAEMEELKRGRDWPDFDFQATHSGCKFVRSFLSTVIAARYPVQALIVSIGDLDDPAFEFSATIQEGTKAAFSKLRKLEIAAERLNFVFAEVTPFYLNRMLVHATQLEEVTLVGKESTAIYIEDFRDNVRSKKIKSLELRNLDLTLFDGENILQTTLQKTGLALERLVLDIVTIDDDYQWMDLAAWMLKDMHALKYLRIRNLSYVDGRYILPMEEARHIEGEFRGREAVE